MITVGLTGGIACGKSTVARLLRDRGVPVLDADQVARDVVAPATPGLAAIVDRFGDDVLDRTGSLDRKRLGTLVVDDPPARRDLEAITHPRIWAAMEQWLDRQRQAGAPAAVVEAALMVETGSHRRYDRVVVVRCRPTTQVERLITDRGMSRAAAQSWLATQMPADDKARVADIVIDNDGSPDDLPAAVEAAWQTVLGLRRRSEITC